MIQKFKNLLYDTWLLLIIVMAFIFMPFLLLSNKYYYKANYLIKKYNKNKKCKVIYLRQYYKEWSDKNSTITLIYEKDGELYVDNITNKYILFERSYSDDTLIFCEIDEDSDDTLGKFKYKNYIVTINYTDDSFMTIDNIDINKC